MFISPGAELFKLGPFTLKWYGLLIASSVMIGLVLSSRLSELRSLGKDLISDLMPLLVLSAVIGARLYYVSFEWHSYRDNLIKIFAIWEGGIAIHGALIVGTISLAIYCRWKRKPFLDVLDVLVPSVALGQAIGRWGNFFNSEAFGLPTNLPWKLYIPYSSRPTIYSGEDFFHPTFLYESIWNIVLFIILIIIFRREIQKKSKPPSGVISCIYFIGYSLGRVWIEGFRIDPLCIGSMPPTCEGGIRIAQLISVFLIFLGGAVFWWLIKRQQKMS